MPARGASRAAGPPGRPPRTTAVAALSRVLNDRNVLGALFMVPALALLVTLLTYPLGLGGWLGFTDTTIGRAGTLRRARELLVAVPGLGLLALGLQHLLLHGRSRASLKFLLGLWLALLLNRNIPFKSFVRAIMLLPFIVPTVLSAIAFWWIYDSQFSIISWTLQRLGLIDHFIDFLGDPLERPVLPHRRQHLARHPIRRDLAPRGAADHLAVASTRRPPSTAPRAGSSSGTSPCRCSPRSSRW